MVRVRGYKFGGWRYVRVKVRASVALFLMGHLFLCSYWSFQYSNLKPNPKP
jgi:hypothetical protein